MPGGKRWKKHRAYLYLDQKGKCYWCGCQMVLPRLGLPPNTTNLCTVDHLRDRFDPTRLDPIRHGERRHVAACYDCNQKRSKESILANIEEHKRRCIAGHERASLTSPQPSAQDTQVMTT